MKDETAQIIIDHVADHFHLKPKDLIRRSRTAPIVNARGIAAYILKHSNLGLSLSEIAEILNLKSHASIIHSLKSIDQSPLKLATANNIRSEIFIADTEIKKDLLTISDRNKILFLIWTFLLNPKKTITISY